MASTAIADVGPGVCDGERPQFEDPKYQLFGGDQILVGAQWRVDDSQGVLTVYDLTGQSSAPLDTDWPVLTYSHQDWVRSQMGSLFGVALDDRGNIYTSRIQSGRLALNRDKFIKQMPSPETQLSLQHSQTTAIHSSLLQHLESVSPTQGSVTYASMLKNKWYM